MNPTPSASPFLGFSKDTIRFLRALKRNNDRDWFLKRRPDFETFVREPSVAFTVALAPELRKASPHLVANPRSLRRIHRDTRFSEDKSPYKTWISFTFKDRRGTGDFSPSLHLGYDPSGILYGAGVYEFSTAERDLFRSRITEGETAKEFTRIVRKLRTAGFEFRGQALKRTPPGFDPGHPNAEFLRYNGLYVGYEEDLPAEFYTPRFVKRAARIYARTTPLMDWLAELGRAAPRGLARFLRDEEG